MNRLDDYEVRATGLEILKHQNYRWTEEGEEEYWSERKDEYFTIDWHEGTCTIFDRKEGVVCYNFECTEEEYIQDWISR